MTKDYLKYEGYQRLDLNKKADEQEQSANSMNITHMLVTYYIKTLIMCSL